MLVKSKFREGYKLSKKNALRIIKEAKTLYQKEFYASACYLGFLGIEEIGKAMLFLKYWDCKEITLNYWNKEFKNHVTKLHIIILIIIRYIKEIHKKMPKIASEKAYDLREEEFERDFGEIHQKAKMWSVFVDYDFVSNNFIHPQDDYISNRIESYSKMLFLKDIGYIEMALNALDFFEQDVLTKKNSD